MSSTPDLTYEQLLEAHTRLQAEFQCFKDNNAALLRATIHELRTPLTAILGFFSLVDPSMTAEQLMAYIPPILQEGERLALAITDLHFQNELDSSRMTFKLISTSVDRLLDRAIRDCQHRSPDRDILKRASRLAPSVGVDPEKAGAVLDILLRTATRFSPAESPIEITVDSQAAMVVITIHSQSLGIPEEYRDAVFAKFIEVPLSGGRTRLALGLGLYAAREMARRMKGEVELLETGKDGTTFAFRMPVVQSDSYEVQHG